MLQFLVTLLLSLTLAAQSFPSPGGHPNLLGTSSNVCIQSPTYVNSQQLAILCTSSFNYDGACGVYYLPRGSIGTFRTSAPAFNGSDTGSYTPFFAIDALGVNAVCTLPFASGSTIPGGWNGCDQLYVTSNAAIAWPNFQNTYTIGTQTIQQYWFDFNVPTSTAYIGTWITGQAMRFDNATGAIVASARWDAQIR